MLFSRLEAYARREKNGRLPIPVNFLLDEFPSIGKLGDFKRSIAFTRSFGMNCQILVQSIAQLADMYPRHEWEEIAACCDVTICLGVNDLTSAKFISEKCGMTTIQVTNNQQPLTPLFSPLQNTIRPYSMTRSNTQRALMQPDEVLRLDNSQCIVLLRGQFPMLLYKITPQEFADYRKLRPVSIRDYSPSESPSPSVSEPSTPEHSDTQETPPNPQACTGPAEHREQTKPHRINMQYDQSSRIWQRYQPDTPAAASDQLVKQLQDELDKTIPSNQNGGKSQ